MITLNDIKNRLDNRFKKEVISSLSSLPHPFALPCLQEGAQRIAEAIQNQKHILVVGDYDADGIISTAIMVLFFQALDYPHFSFVIPNRFKDGYGISIPLLERYPQAELIITVDNGITAIQVAQYCKNKQKTLIITDHHTPKDTLPDALIINPKVSGFVQEEICGAMVAWYLCAGLKTFLEMDFDLIPLLELVGIAIISDVMPLFNINRVVLKKALTLYQNPHFAFSKFLLKRYSWIDEECIGFYIAPLLNASGRMARADLGLDFLLSRDEKEARMRFQALDMLNKERKAIQESLWQEISHHLILTPSCVIAYGEDWHEGVLGILASKLTQEHRRCAFVLSLKEGVYQGSGRASGDVNLISSLQNIDHLLHNFGGHQGAVGLQIKPENLQAFVQNFQPTLKQTQEEDSHFGELHPSLLTPSLFHLLQSYAPYGEGNPRPIFSLSPTPILSQKHIGKEKNHTLLMLQAPRPIKAIAFFTPNLKVDFQTLRFCIMHDSYSSSWMLKICHF